MWRCDEQLLGYCQGEPDWEKPPVDKHIAGEKAESDKVGGTYKLSHLTCGKFSASVSSHSDIDLKGYQHKVIKGKASAEEKLRKHVHKVVEEMHEQGQLF